MTDECKYCKEKVYACKLCEDCYREEFHSNKRVITKRFPGV